MLQNFLPTLYIKNLIIFILTKFIYQKFFGYVIKNEYILPIYML
jgi:hypothetical protein